VTATNEGQARLLAIKGSLASIAARCGVKKPAVSKWRGGAIPADAARALLWSEYGIPARAWDLKPQAEHVAALPALTPERWAEIEAEDAEIERELDELTSEIPDELAMSHPLYRDMHAAVLAALPDRTTRCAVMNAVAEVEDAIGRDGWRPWRRPTPPEGQNP
jgi:transcriptional regulator with XRE-family HTH domain